MTPWTPSCPVHPWNSRLTVHAGRPWLTFGGDQRHREKLDSLLSSDLPQSIQPPAKALHLQTMLLAKLLVRHSRPLEQLHDRRALLMTLSRAHARDPAPSDRPPEGGEGLLRRTDTPKTCEQPASTTAAMSPATPAPLASTDAAFGEPVVHVEPTMIAVARWGRLGDGELFARSRQSNGRRVDGAHGRGRGRRRGGASGPGTYGRARGTGGERARRRAPRARTTRGLTFAKAMAFPILCLALIVRCAEQ